MKTQTTYSDKSLLTIFTLFCKSDLQQIVLQFFSSLTGLLCITFIFHYVLLLLCLLFSLFLIYISFHYVHQLKVHPPHHLLSPFLLFHSFSMQNDKPGSVSLIFFYTHFLDDSISPSNRSYKDIFLGK
jgi:hypothetical protein